MMVSRDSDSADAEAVNAISRARGRRPSVVEAKRVNTDRVMCIECIEMDGKFQGGRTGLLKRFV